MLEVISGDPDKLGILYERYKMPLYGYFFRLTGGDADTSEDLIHTVFYKVLKYRHSFRGTGTFAKWLFSIAHNTGVDHLKRNSRSGNMEAGQDIEDESENILTGMIRSDEISTMQIALDKLNDSDRELLLLAKIRMLKYSEIADIYDCSEVAVKTRIFRALRRLREIFNELELDSYEKER